MHKFINKTCSGFNIFPLLLTYVLCTKNYHGNPVTTLIIGKHRFGQNTGVINFHIVFINKTIYYFWPNKNIYFILSENQQF